MGISLADALSRISGDSQYSSGCRRAYALPVNTQCLTKAIASFERILTSSGSRFDRYLFDGENQALTEQEKNGWQVFSGRGACIDCHDVFHPSVNPLGGAYATFSDERFHNLGVGYHNGVMNDPGRYSHTRRPEDFGAFKTPMLRNIAKTAPYMHDGSLETLDDVVDFYNQGGNANARRSPGVKRLFLSTSERASLVAFLKSLDSDYYTPDLTHPERSLEKYWRTRFGSQKAK
jgi:cytochrome c peroxidase